MRQPRCEFCGQPGIAYKNSRSKLDPKDWRTRVDGANGLEVHHLHYRNLGNEHPEDLVVLCTNSLHSNRNIGCHEIAHKNPLFRAAVERLVERRERQGL